MLAPAAPALRPGAGRLAVELVDGSSCVTACAARSPARLLTPIHRGPAAWCYATSFGGGLVAGDHLDLALAIGPGATAFCSTQASTKVYRAVDDALARQDLSAEIAAGGLLVNAPAQVTAFRGARFRAHNRYRLAAGASLVALDWFSAGRSAYGEGEDWAFDEFATTTSVVVDGEELLRDAVELAPVAGLPDPAQRMGGMRAMASVIVLGERVRDLAVQLAAAAEGPIGRGTGLRHSLSPVADGCLWRLAAPAVEPLHRALATALAPMAAQLGGDPWQRTF